MRITLNKAAIKQQVEILRGYLKEPLSQSSAYNCIAKIYGFNNWNEFKAILDKSAGMK